MHALERLKDAVPRPIARRLLDVQRLIFRVLAYTSLSPITTYQLIRRYCKGRGLEIGPGPFPYCPRSRTTFVEKYANEAPWLRRTDLIADANDLPMADESQDFAMSSHVLEHQPDTLRTLHEWVRVLRPSGILFLSLPHGERTFDRRRPRTPLQHHVDDFARGVDATDGTHDGGAALSWSAARFDPFPGDPNAIARGRAEDLIHYHVWTQDEVVRLVQYIGLQVVVVAEQVADRHDTFVVIGRKHPASPT